MEVSHGTVNPNPNRTVMTVTTVTGLHMEVSHGWENTVAVASDQDHT